MTTNRNDIPSPSAPNFQQRVRETLMTYLGQQGNALDRGLTLRDLIDNGIIKLAPNWRPDASVPALLPGSQIPSDEVDLTPPPTPTGFALAAGITNVFIEHDEPTFLQGRGYKQTRVYGLTVQAGDPLPTFNQAIEITQFSGVIHAHPSNPSLTWRIWIKWETNDGVLSASPAGGTNGLEIVTGQDVALLLEALTGQITESQLFADLGARIDLIDGDGAGSVNARVLQEAILRAEADAVEALNRAQDLAAEASARAAAIAVETDARVASIAAEAQARTDAIAQEVIDRNAAIAIETQARVDAVTELTGDIVDTNAAIAAEAQARIDAVQAEADARVDAISTEARIRAKQVQENAEALLRNAIAVDIERIGRGEAVAQARFELNTDIEEGLSAEASARLLLQAEVADNAAQIVSEQTARATADSALAQDITTLTAQTGTNAAAIASETLARTSADDALASQITTLGATVAGNTAAITTEQTARATADDALSSQITVVASNVASNLAAIQSETTARTTADTALAGQITTLTTTVNANTAAITSEQTARANADSALAADITTLNADVDDAFAAIQDEATARSTGDTAEATARTTLATQLRGAYTGNDLSMVATGLIYQERVARVNEDNSLAQQITLLSAGAGEQFDWQTIWYFDTGVESWTGNGTPTVSQGWLRPADQASDAYVESPIGVGADGNKYGQVRLRIRKVGTPTFAGFLWWRGTADTTWDAARRIALTEPTYNDDDIGLITVSPSWAITIDRIRIDLSSAQSATDYFEIDWTAIGRPSPGASSAQLLGEQTARANADAAEATAREALSVALVGQEDPTGLTLPSLAAGLLFDERSARATQDGVLSTSITSLQATVTSNNTTLSAAITAEQTARISADSALTTSLDSLTSTVGDNTAAIIAEQSTRADADTALSTSLTTLTGRVDGAEADIISEASTRASADSAEVTARQTLATSLLGQADPTGLTLGTLASGLIFDERSARTTQDEAIATSVTSLQTTVTNNYDTLDAAITTEATARSTADTAEATQRESLSAFLTGQTDPSGLTLGTLASGLIYDERTARATADSAISTTVSGLSSSVGGLSSDLTSLQETVATLDTAVAQDITTLVASDRKQNKALDQNAEAVLWDVLAVDAERTQREETVALARDELTVKIEDGLLAESSSRLLLAARVDDNAAAIVSEQTARATQDEAITTNLTELIAQTGSDAQAAIIDEATARTTADSALSSQIVTLSATVADNTAAIQTETTARANADSAISSQITTLTATVGSNTAAIITETTARADADSALSSSISTLASSVGSNTSAILSEATTRAGADTALATSITTLTAAVDDNTAAILTETSARVSADSALSTQITALTATVSGNTAAITSEATTRANADSSLSTQITTVSAQATKTRTYSQASAPTTGMIAGDLWFDTDDSNKAYRYTGSAWVVTDDTRIAANSAAITSEATARANADSALSSSITTLQTTVNGNTASIQTNATSINGVQAKYSVKVDVNGYVSGFGLVSTANNATPTSDFIIRADKFSIASPSGPGITPIVPFIVNTTAQTINGVSVPAGVYMDAAYIKNGTITTAKIGNAAIDEAKIADLAVSTAKIANAAITNAKINDLSADKINAGTINAERIGAGSIDATKIDSRNLTIKDGSGNIIFGSGINLDWSRIASQPSNIYNGNISLGSNGVLYGAGGGSVTLGGLGAGSFAYLSTLTSGNITSYIAGAAIGTALIQDAAIGSAKIANTIQSDNFAATAGWQINKSGVMYLNQAYVRGEINVGASAGGYNWPPGSGNGIHLSATGLLVGNANAGGKYLQIYTPAGDPNAYIYTNIPAYIENGQITTAKIGTAQIDTLRIAGNAVTVAAAAAGTGTSTVYLGAPEGGLLTIIAQVDQSGNDNPNNQLNIYINGGLAEIVKGTPVVIGNTGGDAGSDIYGWSQAVRVRAWGVGAGTTTVTFQSTEGRYYTGIALLTQR